MLSLKVKPFVILTGNSGTGKTKLAQLFANYVSHHDIDVIVNRVKTSNKVGKSATSGGWSLNNEDVKKFIPIDVYQKELPIIVDGIEGIGKINMNTRLFFKSDEIYDRLSKLRDEDPNQKVDIELIVDSFNSRSKSNNNSKQYKVIPVGSNWTENRNVLGFYNVITEEYNETPAYALIKNAQKDLVNPYFLILDEMNLSHVERYFADFLSAIESNEAIPLYSGNDCDDNYELKLPENLFIIGTVNVDETTYMFSPKVLDRANTIEFDSMSVSDYMNNDFKYKQVMGNISFLLDPLQGIEVRRADIHVLHDMLCDVMVENSSLWDVLSDELNKLQEILKLSGFDFGFRVINEILRFMVVSWMYEGSPNNWGSNWMRYFDAQIKQKILPKLHGSEKSLSETLNKLYKFCLFNESFNVSIKNTGLSKNDYKYYTSALKIKEMSNVLSEQRYVSFIN
ncbi:hypothetical protein [Methanosphaera sp. WGK6]|uniref:hypothetical protein n=1 Tax=Methanosphaera sp. WGK6 TaxID=1561964 RepID=UPI000A6241B7|nr:hypothetical protein [Methanosphaera sp. WGK6]